MNGARFIYDSLELMGGEVEVADSAENEGSRTTSLQDRQDRRVDPC